MSKNTKQRHKNVIVVGAGLGGLSAAISLKAEGFEVEIVEPLGAGRQTHG